MNDIQLSFVIRIGSVDVKYLIGLPHRYWIENRFNVKWGDDPDA